MIIVPADVNPAELLVESLVICVILLLLFVVVFLVVEAVLSTLATYVDSFLLNSSQVESVGCHGLEKDVEAEPIVIELLVDDDDEEVSSDEEDDDDNDEDEVIYLGTFRATTAPERPRKTVSFGNVQVQEYSVTLGDNPCADETGGYPLSLDWAHTEVVEYSLDWYEETKSEGACAELSAGQRKRRIEDVTGVNPVVLEWKEEHRLLKLAEGKQDASHADSVDEHANGCVSEEDVVDDDDDEDEDEAFILGTF
jgi:hypothetical protein